MIEVITAVVYSIPFFIIAVIFYKVTILSYEDIRERLRRLEKRCDDNGIY